MFTREYLLSSDWYLHRLKTKQEREIGLWQRHISYLDDFIGRPGYTDLLEALNVPETLDTARERLNYVQSDAYLEKLQGTLGADPL